MSELTADQIIAELRKMENSAQVVLDSGFGTHEGEHDLIYRKRRDIAKGAADLIESLQRERDNPQPLTCEGCEKEQAKENALTRSAMPERCKWCTRHHQYSDRYEPKGEHHE